jgi:uncharacterized protein YndB with AHSA1/START domain
MVVTTTIATNRLSKEAAMREPMSNDGEVRREVEVEASPEEVFEALVTEEGRERWLEEPERQIHIESADPPERLSWWWTSESEPATRVEFRILACPRGARVVVTESAPTFPLLALAASFELVAA